MKLPANITIIGAGLLGTSLALALRQAGYAGRLTALGRSPASIETALSRGAFTGGTCDAKEALAGADLVIVCTALGAFEEAYGLIEKFAPEGAVVTDVGSTKSSVAAAARKIFKNPRRVIGAHPMAGSEKSGPSAGQADLYAGKPCILTVCPSDEPHAVAMVEELWGNALQMRLFRMSPEDHDRAVADISHLPHLVAMALAVVGQSSKGIAVASTGYRDATRLAASHPGIWADIFAQNKEAVLASLAQFKKELAEFERLIEADDRAKLEEKIAPISKARGEWKMG